MRTISCITTGGMMIRGEVIFLIGFLHNHKCHLTKTIMSDDHPEGKIY